MLPLLKRPFDCPSVLLCPPPHRQRFCSALVNIFQCFKFLQCTSAEKWLHTGSLEKSIPFKRSKDQAIPLVALSRRTPAALLDIHQLPGQSWCQSPVCSQALLWLIRILVLLWLRVQQHTRAGYLPSSAPFERGAEILQILQPVTASSIRPVFMNWKNVILMIVRVYVIASKIRYLSS